jgi:hypothetical protein
MFGRRNQPSALSRQASLNRHAQGHARGRLSTSSIASCFSRTGKTKSICRTSEHPVVTATTSLKFGVCYDHTRSTPRDSQRLADEADDRSAWSSRSDRQAQPEAALLASVTFLRVARPIWCLQAAARSCWATVVCRFRSRIPNECDRFHGSDRIFTARTKNLPRRRAVVS